jgi:SWI/SNF-related matrix-associated actin-dependent regulator 1 of chromatin subfamily A
VAHLATGRKLVLFGIHRSVTVEMAKRFGAPMVVGGMSEADRSKAVARFQNDDDCRLIVCSIDAAGFGLTLTAASDVACAELPWNPAKHAQAAGRIHRIGQVAETCNVWNLVIPYTIDSKMQSILAQKAQLVDAVTDGEMADDELSFSVLAEVSASYLEDVPQ